MKQLLNTLYVMTQGSYLRLDHETLKLEVEREIRLQVPIHHLGGIVLFGQVMVSPFVLHRCGEDGRSVVFLSRTGRFKGRLVGPQSGNILLRRAQYAAFDDPERTLDLCRRMVAGKIHNARSALLRAAREANGGEDRETLQAAARELAVGLRTVEFAETADIARGIEGQAAKSYFAAFSSFVRVHRDTFALDGRNRRPPRDRINALLSFLYALLLNDCQSACETVGLDPQLGFLHALRPGRPSLALDLMEEFRSYIADRLAITLINRRQLTAEDFEERPGGAVLLKEDGRKQVVAAYQNRKQEELVHPLLQQKMAVGLLPLIQARLLARVVRGEDSGYVPFVSR